MADEDDGVTPAGVADRFQVHLGDERAGGVDHVQLPACGVGPHGRGHAVRAEHHHRSCRHLIELVDEDRASLGKLRDDVPVMDNLLADIDGRAQLLQRQVHDVDGADDTGAKSTRAWHHQHAGFETGRISAFIRSVVHERP